MRVPGNGDTFVPQACQRKLAIFDGRMRYDLQLAFKRLDQVKVGKGLSGHRRWSARCDFSPIAGHIPDRAAIKYLADLRDIELWLAPIAGHPGDGALPGLGSDPDRDRRHAGDPVRLGAAAGQAEHVGQSAMSAVPPCAAECRG